MLGKGFAIARDENPPAIFGPFQNFRIVRTKWRTITVSDLDDIKVKPKPGCVAGRGNCQRSPKVLIDNVSQHAPTQLPEGRID